MSTKGEHTPAPVSDALGDDAHWHTDLILEAGRWASGSAAELLDGTAWSRCRQSLQSLGDRIRSPEFPSDVATADRFHTWLGDIARVSAVLQVAADRPADQAEDTYTAMLQFQSQTSGHRASSSELGVVHRDLVGDGFVGAGEGRSDRVEVLDEAAQGAAVDGGVGWVEGDDDTVVGRVDPSG